MSREHARAQRQQRMVNHRRAVDTRRIDADAQKNEHVLVACEGCLATIYVVAVRSLRASEATHRALMRQALDAHMRATGCSGSGTGDATCFCK